ncbi:caspase, EACC1-associated type [Microbispora bryophytorum]|uniref:caspase, EACC1-associated type n=1 Tax=Microbispora bryophytorum TaxID=1460882 RepID=UPI0037117A0D
MSPVGLRFPITRPGTQAAMRLDSQWAGCRAILIGVSAYRDDNYTDIPAAANSLKGMYEVLTDPELCGWPEARVEVLANPVDNRAVAKLIRRLAQETSQVFLLYYVGHGTLTPRGDLCLTLADTEADAPDLTGLEYNRVREAFRDSLALVKASILDCCYSGQVIRAETLADPGAILADASDVRGVYTLTAADLAAHVPPPDLQVGACTSFTGELLDLVRTGIPGQPDPLTLGTLYLALRRRLRARGLPDPNQRGTDTAHSFPFTRNAATIHLDCTVAADPLQRSSQATLKNTSQAVPLNARSASTIKPMLTRRRAIISLTAAAIAAGVSTVIPLLAADSVTGTTDTPRTSSSFATRSAVTRSPDSTVTSSAVLSPLAISSDGKTLVGTDDTGTLYVSDLGSSRKLKEKVGAVTAAALSPDGIKLATAGSAGIIDLWNTRTGLSYDILVGHSRSVVALQFSQDGTSLVSASRDGTVRTWRLPAGTAVAGWGMADPLYRGVRPEKVAVSPDGKSIAFSVGQKVQVWNVRANRTLATCAVRPVSVKAIAFHPNAEIVAFSSGAKIYLCDVKTGETIGPPLESDIGSIDLIAFSDALKGENMLRSGRELFGASRGSVQRWPDIDIRTTFGRFG